MSLSKPLAELCCAEPLIDDVEGASSKLGRHCTTRTSPQTTLGGKLSANESRWDYSGVVRVLARVGQVVQHECAGAKRRLKLP